MSDPGAAREQAREILAERRFHDHGLPDPFRDVLDRVAGWIDSFLGLFDGLGIPGGRPVVWLVLALIAAIAASLIAGRATARRRAAAPARNSPIAASRKTPSSSSASGSRRRRETG